MPRVHMYFSEHQFVYFVVFTEPGTLVKIGRSRTYNDSSRLFDILRAAHAPSEDHQIVEYALASRRPGSVALNLSAEQYHRLKFGR